MAPSCHLSRAAHEHQLRGALCSTAASRPHTLPSALKPQLAISHHQNTPSIACFVANAWVGPFPA